jgi:hypothetical protein
LIGSLEALGSGSKPLMFSLGKFKPTNFSISQKDRFVGLNNEIASPLAPLFLFYQCGERNLQEY